MTGTGIAITGVTAENVTFVEIGMVLLVMEALLPISEVGLNNIHVTLFFFCKSQLIALLS